MYVNGTTIEVIGSLDVHQPSLRDVQTNMESTYNHIYMLAHSINCMTSMHKRSQHAITLITK